MDSKRSRVVPLNRNGLLAEDADIIELMVRAHLGIDVPIEQMESTQESMDAISQRMASERDTTLSESYAWRFPIMQWRYRTGTGLALVLIVIDQGLHRYFTYKAAR